MKDKRLRLWALAALMGWGIALPSGAIAAPGMACDGYGAASKSGDGMSEYATVLYLFSPPGYGTTARTDPGKGAAAIADCDAALSALAPIHWRRRINLLQARGLHRLEGGQNEEALRDLELAAETARPHGEDTLFNRSQQVGLALSRAYALKAAGNGKEADAMMLQAGAARPYERGVNSAILQLGESNRDGEPFRAARERLMRIDPQARTSAAVELFEEGRFEDFLALLPYLAEPPNYPRGNELPVLTALRELGWRERSLQFHVLFGGAHAYALTALGRYPEAEDIFRQLRKQATADRTAPPPPKLAGPALEQYTRLLAAWQKRLSGADEMISQLEYAAARRRSIADGRSQEVTDSLAARPLLSDGTGADTLAALAQVLTGQQAEDAKAKSVELRKELATKRRSDKPIALADLFAAMPAAETPGRLSTWGEAKRPFMAMKGSIADTTSVGYRETDGEDGRLTIRFRGGNSPSGQVEEMALLRAAEVARGRAQKGFVVLNRRDTAWTFGTTYMGTTVRTDPGGHETELDIQFVDPQATKAPAFLVVDAEAVYENLAPIYIPPPTMNANK